MRKLEQINDTRSQSVHPFNGDSRRREEEGNAEGVERVIW